MAQNVIRTVQKYGIGDFTTCHAVQTVTEHLWQLFNHDPANIATTRGAAGSGILTRDFGEAGTLLNGGDNLFRQCLGLRQVS